MGLQVVKRREGCIHLEEGRKKRAGKGKEKGGMEGGREGGKEGKRERRERATLLVGLNQEVGDSWVTGLQSHGEGVVCFLGVANIKGLKGKFNTFEVRTASH